MVCLVLAFLIGNENWMALRDLFGEGIKTIACSYRYFPIQGNPAFVIGESSGKQGTFFIWVEVEKNRCSCWDSLQMDTLNAPGFCKGKHEIRFLIKEHGCSFLQRSFPEPILWFF